MTSRIHALGVRLAVVAAISMAVPLAAQDENPRPDAVQAVYSCRTITDTQQRLSCYDARVADLMKAEQERDVLMVDRETVEQKRKDSFGVRASANIFGDEDSGDADDGVQSITAKIVAMTDFQARWAIVLDGGSQWQTTDGKARPRTFREGEDVVIERGPLGSFMAKAGKGRSVRMKRVK